jgi:hypothetical protein
MSEQENNSSFMRIIMLMLGVIIIMVGVLIPGMTIIKRIMLILIVFPICCIFPYLRKPVLKWMDCMILLLAGVLIYFAMIYHQEGIWDIIMGNEKPDTDIPNLLPNCIGMAVGILTVFIWSKWKIRRC